MGDSLQVRFTRRDFSGPLVLRGLRFAVDRLEWRAVGGPWKAELTASAATAAELWETVGLLRCGLMVTDQLGPAWWGYVATVELQAGGERLRASLDAMGNRVTVGYRAYSPEAYGRGPLTATPFEVDANSVRTYGQKEKMYRLEEATPEEAQAYAKTMLGRVSRPVVQAGSKAAAGTAAAVLQAKITCRGWWETLDWKYAPEPRGRIEYVKGSAEWAFGTGRAILATSFNLGSGGPWLISEAWARIRRVGNPATGLAARLSAHGTDAPGVTLANSSDVAPGAVPDRMDWTRFVFPTPYLAPASTTLWLGIRRLGTVDAVNGYSVGVDLSLGSSDYVRFYDGAAWLAMSPDGDMPKVVLGVEESTEQIRRMLASTTGAGQFLTGARVYDPSALNVGMYRDGSDRAREVAERLLALGTVTGRGLLARVEENRTARIYAKPDAASAAVRIDAAGRLRAWSGRLLAPSEWCAGEWARVQELGAAGGLFGFTGAVFLEGCAWDGARGLHGWAG